MIHHRAAADTLQQLETVFAPINAAAQSGTYVEACGDRVQAKAWVAAVHRGWQASSAQPLVSVGTIIVPRKRGQPFLALIPGGKP